MTPTEKTEAARIAETLRNGGGESLHVQSEGIAVILEFLRDIPTRAEVHAIVAAEVATIRANLAADADATLTLGRLAAHGRPALRLLATALAWLALLATIALLLAPRLATIIRAWKGIP